MREWKALPTENKNKTIKKMVVGSYISIITLNVNGLNAPSKRHRLVRQMKICACMHFHLPHHSAWPFKLYVITLYGFSRIHVWMWELDNKKGWRPKNWCPQTGAGEDSWEFLGQQGYQTINPKGNQSWIFIRRTDDEAEASILCPPDVKSWLIGKDSDAGKDWR